MRIREQWTELELEQEIDRLDRRIADANKGGSESKRCAASFLRQLRVDRNDALTLLRKRKDGLLTGA